MLIADLDAGSLLVLQRATCQELKRIAVGHRPEGIEVAPDGSHAFVAVTGDDNVAVVDLRVLELRARIRTAPVQAAWPGPFDSSRESYRSAATSAIFAVWAGRCNVCRFVVVL